MLLRGKNRVTILPHVRRSLGWQNSSDYLVFLEVFSVCDCVHGLLEALADHLLVESRKSQQVRRAATETIAGS